MTSKYIIILFLLLFSCKTENVTEPTVYQIEPALQPYLDTFYSEAKARGINISPENLILSFSKNLTLSEACGQCSQTVNNSQKQRKIEINEATLCWKSNVNASREALVFHELGHCLLGRIAHKNDLFADDSPKSIMISGANDLYTPCVYDINNDLSCNKTERRQYYIDELFNPNTAKPAWAK